MNALRVRITTFFAAVLAAAFLSAAAVTSAAAGPADRWGPEPGGPVLVVAGADAAGVVAEYSGEYEYEFEDEFEDEYLEEVKGIADPLEPFNRAMFVFNDKLYFWVLKPVATGYSAVVPEFARVGVSRFFTNLATPIRFVNSVLQLKFDKAGTELARFAINTTVGVLGFTDPARDRWDIYMHKEDFGQTLGRYGAGPGIFITWPVFGPSSLRDTVGLVGDFFLDPINYIFAEDAYAGLAVRAYERVNTTSLNIGVYEDLKADALDPYTFIRDAYHQHREKQVSE